jgi:Uma2 family endonuclease
VLDKAKNRLTGNLLQNTFDKMYAKAGIPEYWIINLIARQLEVYRCPLIDVTQLYGFGYAEVTIFIAAERVASLAMLEATIAVADMLP